MPIKKTITLGTLIDSLEKSQFFIPDRPNPDVPVAATTSNGRTAAPRTAQPANLPVEYPDETYMVLGNQLNNPYSIANMTAAYNTYFNLNLSSVQTTHWYVRFAPQQEAHIALLEDSLELDLYTHPLDYELLVDGDLYVAPGKTIEDIPMLYTVVEPGFTFPAGIPYTILAPLHLPEGDHGLLLEQLAESMALGASYSSTSLSPDSVLITRTNATLQAGEPNPQYLNEDAQCYIENDLGIYIGDCPDFGDDPPPPPPPATSCGLPVLSCIESGKPRGRIRVWDTQLQRCEPVRDVKVRSKNWYRIRNSRTNDQGEFVINKKYERRVKVNLIFRNDEVTIRPLRHDAGIRLSLFPITYTLGVYRDMCAANTIDKIFYRPEDRTTREFEAWVACNAVNSRKEQIQFAQNPSEGIKVMDNFRLNIYLEKQGIAYSEGPTADLLLQNYLYRTRGAGEWMIEVVKLALYYFSNDWIGLAVTFMSNVLGSQRPDIIYSYNTHPNNPVLALQNLSSNEVKQEFYEVYTQAGVLKATQNDIKWKNYFKLKSKFVDAGSGAIGSLYKLVFKRLKTELPMLPGAISSTSPIGPYGSPAAAIIGLFQVLNYRNGLPEDDYYEMVLGFGSFYGHRMCDLRYGQLADAIYNQKRQLIASAGGISAHQRLLEDWQPNVEVDMDRHNRIGLFYDLMDTNIDEVIPENVSLRRRADNVRSHSIKSMFNSITGQGTGIQWVSPELWLHFRANTTSQYPAQSFSINELFLSYLIPFP